MNTAHATRGRIHDFTVSCPTRSGRSGVPRSPLADALDYEQVEGRDAVPASDVSSLGLVLLEALTGRGEYPGAVVDAAFARLDREPIVPGWITPALAEVLHSMTLLRPAERSTLPEVALGLQQFLVDESIRQRQLGSTLVNANEAGRITALRHYDILDTEPEETFDAITRLVSRTLPVPIALVTLVDMNRVWFKSAVGWDERQVDRDIAFCSTTNPGTDRPWSVPDALADERTSENPLVVDGPRVRSYAGAPLLTRDGHCLGAVCALDREARRFSAEHLDSLADFAGLVMHELELRRAVRRALFSKI